MYTLHTTPKRIIIQKQPATNSHTEKQPTQGVAQALLRKKSQLVTWAWKNKTPPKNKIRNQKKTPRNEK